VLAAFVWQEQRSPEPILPLDLFRNRVVSVADAAFVLAGTMSPTVVTFISLYVQGVVGASATVAGLSLIPMSIGWPLASAVAGQVIIKIGFRWTGLLGASLAVAGGIVLVSSISLSTGYGSVAVIGCAILLLGAGLGFLTTTAIVSLQSSVPWSTRGVATGSAMFSRLLGSTLGIALLGSILNAVLLSRVTSLPADVREAGGDGVGVTSVLLDAQARAALDPAALAALQGVLAVGIQAVFVGVLVSAIAALAVVSLLPHRAEEPAVEQAA
jgi:hypothetical protein